MWEIVHRAWKGHSGWSLLIRVVNLLNAIRRDLLKWNKESIGNPLWKVNKLELEIKSLQEKMSHVLGVSKTPGVVRMGVLRALHANAHHTIFFSFFLF